MKKNLIMRPHRVLLSLCFLVGLLSPWSAWGSQETTAPSPAPSAPAVVAEGTDGFRVTEKDVQDLIDFFTTHTMFQTSEKEYRRYTVQTFLFAREAERLGLHAKETSLPQESIPRHLALANLYLSHRLQNLPLEPEAVQSYYRAFPEKFLKNPGADKWRSQPSPVIGEEDLVPFEQVASQIEAFLRGQLKKKVEGLAFQELMAAYRVAIK